MDEREEKIMSTATAPALIVSTPAPVTIAAPDANALTEVFNSRIAPLSDFRVKDAETYIRAKGELFLAVTGYLEEAEKLFDPSCKAAYAAHKAMTGLRNAFTSKAEDVKRHLNEEIGKYEREQDRIRRIEEERLQREREAEYRREQELARERAEAARVPWEDDDEPVAVPELAPPPPVRLASNIPIVAGGARTAKKPWAARLVDIDKLWEQALTNPDARQFFVFSQTAANEKARELKAELGNVYPGLEGYQDTTQKRR